MFFNNLPEAKKLWKNGERVIKLIGYDSNEAYRKEKALLSISDKDAGKYDLQFPLIDWKLTREDCVKIIKDAGLCLAGKSACYFCPASKVSEIKQLEANYPELLQRALDLEANAELTRIKGLGNSFSWREAVKTTDIFADQFSLQPEMICGCYDG